MKKLEFSNEQIKTIIDLMERVKYNYTTELYEQFCGSRASTTFEKRCQNQLILNHYNI